MRRLLDRNLAGPVCFAIGLLLLARTYLYYGTLLRGWDAQFYYAAARSLVHDGDLDVGNDLLLSPNPAPLDPDRDGSFRNIPRRPGGRAINFFPVGMSLIEAPALAVGSGLRRLAVPLGYHPAEAPGYSALEINTVAVWLLALFSFGMHRLYGLLAGRATAAWRALALAAAWAGTSLLYYSAVFPFMAHAQAFVLIVCVAGLAKELPAAGPVNRAVALMGLLTVLLFLVRPQQVLFTALLTPVLLPGLVRRPGREWLPGCALGLAVALAGLWFQASVHEANLGRFGLLGRDPNHPHPDVSAHFDWTDPHPDVVLTSPTRGLFFLTPVFVLGVAGALSGADRPGRWLDRVFLVHTLIQVGLVACWSNPLQGDAFGSRMFCESAPLVALGQTALYRPRLVVTVPLAALTVLSIVWTCALMVLYVRGGLSGYPGYADVFRGALRVFFHGR